MCILSSLRFGPDRSFAARLPPPRSPPPSSFQLAGDFPLAMQSMCCVSSFQKLCSPPLLFFVYFFPLLLGRPVASILLLSRRLLPMEALLEASKQALCVERKRRRRRAARRVQREASRQARRIERATRVAPPPCDRPTDRRFKLLFDVFWRQPARSLLY